jgi:hypothetical protein
MFVINGMWVVIGISWAIIMPIIIFIFCETLEKIKTFIIIIIGIMRAIIGINWAIIMSIIIFISDE